MMPNALRHVMYLLLSALLVVGSSAPAFADFWEDAGRVAAGIATGGWSEVVLDLMGKIRAFKDSVEKQLDQATQDALKEVNGAIQGQLDLVAAAEKRVNTALDSGRGAARTYVSTHTISEKARATEGTVGPVAPRESKLGRAVTQPGRVPGPSFTPPPDDVAVISKADGKLLSEGQDFRNLAGEIRKGLNGISTTAEAHVTTIKTDVVNKIFPPCDEIYKDLSLALIGGPFWGGVSVFTTYQDGMAHIKEEWQGDIADIDTNVTGPAYDAIAAAHAGRATPAADRIEKLAGLIVAAAGTGPAAAQAMDQLREELGLRKAGPFAVRAPAAGHPLGEVAGAARPGMGQGTTRTASLRALTAHLTEAQRLIQRLRQVWPRLDEGLVRSVDGYLEGQFRGKSPQQVQATRLALLSEARQRFGGQPKVLQVVEHMIDQRAGGRPIGVAPSPSLGRQAPAARP